MKKLLMIAAGIVMAVNSFAATIAYVDPQELLEKYPETRKTQDYLEKKKKEMQGILDTERTKVEEKDQDIKKKGEKATKAEKEELEKMKSEFAKKFEAMQGNLEQLQYNMYEKIKSDINVAISETAKAKKIDIVMDKTVIYYGAEDITKDVLNFLSGVQKIDLK